MPNPIISGGPLLRLPCLSRVRHCLRLLTGVVDCCASRLVRLICCQIILTASSPGSLLIRRSLAIRLRDLTTFAFRSSEARCLLLDLRPYGSTDPLCLFPFFLERTADVLAPCLIMKCFDALFVWVVSRLAGEGQCHHYSERSTVLLCW